MELPEDTTELLQRWDEPAARERLFESVYPELRRLAASRLRRESPGRTLQTADLVHEAFLKMVNQERSTWQNRAHFMAIAAKCMRRIVVDHARRRRSIKRGGDLHRLHMEIVPSSDPFEQLMVLEQLLQQLAKRNPRLVETFELHYFAGATFEEIATVLNVSDRTAKRDWEFTLTYLGEMFQPRESRD